MPVALITGASTGLGLAVADRLADRGWRLVVDARRTGRLTVAAARLAERTDVTALAGDVADPAHRRDLAAAVARLGRLDLLVLNASELGPSPLPSLAEFPLADWERIYAVNVLAPLALTQLLLPGLRATRGTIIAVSSDAAVESYPGWGGYGSAKAALDAFAGVLGVEEAELAVYALDPGDMRTEMHQRAFPGEDITDRPLPGAVAPGLLRLLDDRPPSGRYRAADLLAAGRDGTEPDAVAAGRLS